MGCCIQFTFDDDDFFANLLGDCQQPKSFVDVYPGFSESAPHFARNFSRCGPKLERSAAILRRSPAPGENVTPLTFDIFTFLTSLAAGVVDSIVGIDGDSIIILVSTLIFGGDIRYAIGASIASPLLVTSSPLAPSPTFSHTMFAAHDSSPSTERQ